MMKGKEKEYQPSTTIKKKNPQFLVYINPYRLKRLQENNIQHVNIFICLEVIQRNVLYSIFTTVIQISNPFWPIDTRYMLHSQSILYIYIYTEKGYVFKKDFIISMYLLVILFNVDILCVQQHIYIFVYVVGIHAYE